MRAESAISRECTRIKGESREQEGEEYGDSCSPCPREGPDFRGLRLIKV